MKVFHINLTVKINLMVSAPSEEDIVTSIQDALGDLFKTMDGGGYTDSNGTAHEGFIQVQGHIQEGEANAGPKPKSGPTVVN